MSVCKIPSEELLFVFRVLSEDKKRKFSIVDIQKELQEKHRIPLFFKRVGQLLEVLVRGEYVAQESIAKGSRKTKVNHYSFLKPIDFAKQEEKRIIKKAK